MAEYLTRAMDVEMEVGALGAEEEEQVVVVVEPVAAAVDVNVEQQAAKDRSSL